MADSITTQGRQEAFVHEMTEKMAAIARQLSTWATSEPRMLGEMEQATLQVLHEMGNALLGGLCQLSVPRYPEQQVSCDCGQWARYQRLRTGHMHTLLGELSLTRPYYLCAGCHHGQAPVDRQMGFCAGGISAGLGEVAALLGAQFAFEEAASVLEKLSLVTLCPNSFRAASEALGQEVVEAEQAAVAAAWDLHQPQLPAAPAQVPTRLYVSIDGTKVHICQEGWKEIKLGAVYTTVSRVDRQHPEHMVVRAQDISYYADFADPEAFGQALWLEACRRGLLQAQEVVAVCDGAHWIWKLVEEHFPGAIQIVDWYHAAQYIWNVAHAIYGEGSDLAKQWAQHRLDELWQGQVDAVLHHFQQHLTAGEAVQTAITYYLNNKHRMRYPEYRAKGLQIGSGSIESGCKHVIGARLKQAGMIWGLEGARAIAKLRTRLKSRRWQETVALRSPLQRTYHRKTV